MKKISLYLTSRDGGDRLRKIAPENHLKPSADPDAHASINIDERVTYQTIEGFGGAFTDSTAATVAKLPVKLQEEVLRAYFDNDSGHGYSLCRTHINSCDFSLNNYAYCEKDGDFKLETFTIERDRKFLLPMIKWAQKISREGFNLFASPWSPPPWMKTNGEMNNGGKLKPECRQVWADYYVRYIQEYEKEGVPIWGLTIQNEPAAVQRWDSCVYTGEEERDFVRDFLGPTLEKNGMSDRKVVIWDHNRDKLFERAKAVYDDPEAAKYVWGAGFHWYVADVFESVQRTHDAWPDKALLFTEGCQEGGPHVGAWTPGERYATSIIEDLNHWTVGWVDWNMVLDEKGGPNHVGNYCHAPILIDTQKGEILYQTAYYYLGHFSRFIRPGAKRILCSSAHDSLAATACVNPDGSTAVVVMNKSETPITFLLRTGSGNHEILAPRKSIQTVVLS